jgi:hypothetical protein
MAICHLSMKRLVLDTAIIRDQEIGNAMARSYRRSNGACGGDDDAVDRSSSGADLTAGVGIDGTKTAQRMCECETFAPGRHPSVAIIGEGAEQMSGKRPKACRFAYESFADDYFHKRHTMRRETLRDAAS